MFICTAGCTLFRLIESIVLCQLSSSSVLWLSGFLLLVLSVSEPKEFCILSSLLLNHVICFSQDVMNEFALLKKSVEHISSVVLK